MMAPPVRHYSVKLPKQWKKKNSGDGELVMGIIKRQNPRVFEKIFVFAIKAFEQTGDRTFPGPSFFSSFSLESKISISVRISANLELYTSWFSKFLFKKFKCFQTDELKSSSQKLSIFEVNGLSLTLWKSIQFRRRVIPLFYRCFLKK